MPIGGVFFVPKLGPGAVIFSDPFPPNFSAYNFIVLSWIPKTKSSINLGAENSVPFDQGPIMRGFVPLLEKSAL